MSESTYEVGTPATRDSIGLYTLLLAPHETVARLNDPTPSTSHTQMSALDTEMNYLLRKQYADDSEKWRKYNEALQRFLHFSKESQKPVS